MSLRVASWCLGLAMSVSACAGMSGGSSKQSLKEAVDAYNMAFRWKNYGQASSYLPNENRTAFVTFFDEDSPKLHIEAVKVLEVDFDGEDAAKVRVRYRYMLLPSVTIESKVVEQSWYRKDKSWVLEAEEPLLVDYLTGSEEPETDDGSTNDDGEWSTSSDW